MNKNNVIEVVRRNLFREVCKKKNRLFIHLWWIRVLTPPPPLSTTSKISVITLTIFFIHRRGPPPLPPLSTFLDFSVIFLDKFRHILALVSPF